MLYRIPVIWNVIGVVEVEADTIEKAMDITEDNQVPFPDESEPVEGTIMLDCYDPKAIMENFNR